MTNRSILLLRNMQEKDYDEKEKIVKEILDIEFTRIIAQSKKAYKDYMGDKLIDSMVNLKNSDELFDYLNVLSIVQISMLASYGIDVSFMNLLKVSE